MKCPKCKKEFKLDEIGHFEELRCPYCRLQFYEKALRRYATASDYLSVCQNKEMLLEYIESGGDVLDACSDMDCRYYDCIFNKNDEHANMMADMGFDDEEEYGNFWDGYAPDKD